MGSSYENLHQLKLPAIYGSSLYCWCTFVCFVYSVCPGRERKEGVVYNWTLTFYGSSLTPEDVTSRQEWVGVRYMHDSKLSLFGKLTLSATHTPTHTPTHTHTLTHAHTPYTPTHTPSHTHTHRLVEEAVCNGSVESPFLCPPSNHNQHDIVIPYTPGHSFNTVSDTHTHTHTTHPHTPTHPHIHRRRR